MLVQAFVLIESQVATKPYGGTGRFVLLCARSVLRSTRLADNEVGLYASLQQCGTRIRLPLLGSVCSPCEQLNQTITRGDCKSIARLMYSCQSRTKVLPESYIVVRNDGNVTGY